MLRCLLDIPGEGAGAGSAGAGAEAGEDGGGEGDEDDGSDDAAAAVPVARGIARFDYNGVADDGTLASNCVFNCLFKEPPLSAFVWFWLQASWC